MGPIGYYSCVRCASVPIGFLCLLLTGCYSTPRATWVGKAAPNFIVQDSDRKIELSQLHGDVVVLNFWATWCPPCVDEMPSLVAMQHRLHTKGVRVLAVSIDDDENAYHSFLKNYNVDLLTVRDAAHHSNSLYGTVKFPETYIIDRNGIVRRKFIGAVDWSQPEIVDFLSKL